MKLIITALLLSITLAAHGQSYRNCAVAYHNASEVTYSLEAAYTNTTDPGGSTRNSLDSEAHIYFDASAAVFITTGSAVFPGELCSAGNLAALAAVTREYEARAVRLNAVTANTEGIQAATAAIAELHKHRR